MTQFLCHSSLMQHRDIKPRIEVKAKQKTPHFRDRGLNYDYTKQLASQEFSECRKRLHLSVAVNMTLLVSQDMHTELYYERNQKKVPRKGLLADIF